MPDANINDVQLRNLTKRCLELLQTEQFEDARTLLRSTPAILSYNLGFYRFYYILPEIKGSHDFPNKLAALKLVIEVGFEIFDQEDNVEELVFFAAAKCDFYKLKYCLGKLTNEDPESINKTKDGDTSLMFLLKYGFLGEDMVKCVELLVDAGVDVSKDDYDHVTPLQYSMAKLRQNNNEHAVWEACINSIKPKTVLEPNKKNVVDTLFQLLLDQNQKEFCKILRSNLDARDLDDGHNTLLQLCCAKNLPIAASCLIANGANLCKTTERNQQTPLEIAARRNNEAIFTAILETKKITIDSDLFIVFVQNRPKHIKDKYFSKILQYPGLDVHIKANNGNTPLHYAIILCNSEAIGVLLKRGASLLKKNNSDKCALDYITAEDLTKYFDSCIKLDNYYDINYGKYSLSLNYQNFANDCEVGSELNVVKNICRNEKLQKLVMHPLVSTFMEIKLELAKHFFNLVFFLQLAFYLATLTFLLVPDIIVSSIISPLYFCHFLKAVFLLNWKNNKWDITIDMIVIALSISKIYLHFDDHQSSVLSLVIIVLMGTSLHLFSRFNPLISQIHTNLSILGQELQKFFLYFLSLTIFFIAAAVTVAKCNFDPMTNFYITCTSLTIFVNVIFILIALQIFTSLQDNLLGDIAVKSKVICTRNTLIFLEIVEAFYLKYMIISSPFILPDASTSDMASAEKGKVKNLGRVNFYVNLNLFSSQHLKGIKLEISNILKLKRFIISMSPKKSKNRDGTHCTELNL